METIQLKFLLKLLGFPDYRAKVPGNDKIKPNTGTPASERDRICRDLWKQELVSCSQDVTKIKLTSAGKGLLKVDPAELPLTPEELKILKACEKGTIKATAKETNISPADKLKEVINKLIASDHIQAVETKLQEVWLTERGKNYLATEYDPRGAGNITLTKNMIADYLHFIRQYLASSPSTMLLTEEQSSETPSRTFTDKPSDEQILQLIQDLDEELGTDNYLPIFHLRNQLQPPMTRDEVNEALYRLQGDDKIELSAIAETTGYSREELKAGIPQPLGDSLFFIMVN